MNISDATFAAGECLVTIDGWRANISSKSSLLKAGLCNVTAIDPADAEKADDLHFSPFGDSGVYACSEPCLVELAARHWDWSNTDGHSFDETPAPVITDPVQAARALAAWLLKSNI